MEIVTQVECPVITLAPLESALRAEREGHAERPIKGQDDRLRQRSEHSGRVVTLDLGSADEELHGHRHRHGQRAHVDRNSARQ